MASNPWSHHVDKVSAAEADRELHDEELIEIDPAEHLVPAEQVKGITDVYPNLDDSVLSRLDILKPGTQLRQGSVYLDLAARGRGPFTAMGGERVEEGQWVIAKRLTDYDVWNRLAG